MTFCSTSASSGMNWRDAGEVVRSAARVSTCAAMPRGQRTVSGRVVPDDCAQRRLRRATPHVPFVEPGGIGDLGTARRRSSASVSNSWVWCPMEQQDGLRARALSTAPTIRLANSYRFPGDRRVLIYCRHS